MLTPFQLQALEASKQELIESLTGDLFQDLDIRDKIYQIDMKIVGIVPLEDNYESCEFCSG